MISIAEAFSLSAREKLALSGKDWFVVAVTRAIGNSSGSVFTELQLAYLHRIAFLRSVDAVDEASVIAQAHAIMAGSPLLDAIRDDFFRRAPEVDTLELHPGRRW